MDGKLVSIDIFDYLLYAQQQQATVPQDITTLLGERSSILLNAGQATQTTKFNWIYKAPTDPIKSNFIDVLQSKLTGAANPESNHSDPNSLTLLRTCFPTVNQISNLTQCQNAYISKQMDDLNDNAHHDKDLYRAQIYHPFRAELEAWNIERWYYHRLHQESITADKHISPRVTRFLSYPDMMQAFVRCIATQTIEKVEKTDSNGSQYTIWVFHNSVTEKDIDLTTMNEPKADVMRAAVIFVLRQKEAKSGGTTQIILKHALQSVVKTAQTAQKNVNEMVETFVGKPTDSESSQTLDTFLENNFDISGLSPLMAEREIQNLKIIFQFYGDKNLRTHLGDRIDLP